MATEAERKARSEAAVGFLRGALDGILSWPVGAKVAILWTACLVYLFTWSPLADLVESLAEYFRANVALGESVTGKDLTP